MMHILLYMLLIISLVKSETRIAESEAYKSQNRKTKCNYNQPIIYNETTGVFDTTECIRSCNFPKSWYGNWYQSGIRKTITIKGNRLSSKGMCLSSSGDKKYLIVSEDRNCYRCVAFHERHENILQYKETFCHKKNTLAKICSSITSEALLLSMIRESSVPTKCPFEPPFTFTYETGNGICNHPISSIETCMKDSEFAVRYQACPDVPGSESTTAEIQCIAIWKEGLHQFVIGKVLNYDNRAREDRFLCFLFERASLAHLYEPTYDFRQTTTETPDVVYRVGQSVDAQCSGLHSAMGGSLVMTLKNASYNFSCSFPDWITKKRQWHTLNYAHSYTFNEDNIFTVTNTTIVESSNRGHSIYEMMSSGNTTNVSCSSIIQQTDEFARLIAHYVSECKRGFVCIELHKRSDHIIELQLGESTRRAEDACTNEYFESNGGPFITLVTPEPESKVCPFFGNFLVNGVHGVDPSDPIPTGHEKRSYPTTDDIMGAYAEALTAYFKPEEKQQIQRYKRDKYDPTKMYSVRFKRRVTKQAGKRDKKKTCSLNFSKLFFGCRSPDTMEFRTDCPLFSSDIISVYLCHDSWVENVNRNSSVHYLVTTPLSRTSRGVRRYCFMYQTSNNDSSVIRFTSTADSCHRATTVTGGLEGALSFNITPINTGTAGKCAELNSTNAVFPNPVLILLIVTVECMLVYTYRCIKR